MDNPRARGHNQHVLESLGTPLEKLKPLPVPFHLHGLVPCQCIIAEVYMYSIRSVTEIHVHTAPHFRGAKIEQFLQVKGQIIVQGREPGDKATSTFGVWTHTHTHTHTPSKVVHLYRMVNDEVSRAHGINYRRVSPKRFDSISHSCKIHYSRYTTKCEKTDSEYSNDLLVHHILLHFQAKTTCVCMHIHSITVHCGCCMQTHICEPTCKQAPPRNL